MEKEQKKLLLVAVSVGVFLLVTITAAIFLINQRTQPQEAIAAWTAPQPVIVPPPAQIIDPPAQIIEEHDKNEGDHLIIQITPPATVAIPDTPDIVKVAPALPAVTPRQTQPVQPQNTSGSLPAPARTINDYWIQTGAFTARIRAEDAKETLAEKGLISIIENREINGQIWYRVRLGPYTSQREADYWLALVKSIDGFSESQVWQTTRTQ